MNPVELAIYNKLAGASGLTALLTSGTASIYAYVGPENADPPYVVFNKQANTPAYVMGGTAFENAIYQVRGVTTGPTMAPAGTIAKQIDLALNLASLTITGYTAMVCRRESDIQYVEVTDGHRFNHAGALFRIMADPT